MKIALVANPSAGGGQSTDDLVALLTEAGHSVRQHSSRDDPSDLLQDPGDLIVAVGGDGTVRRVALAAAEGGVPFAVLPFGTANNIGKSLGLAGDTASLVGAWEEEGARRPFDVGEARAAHGTQRFVESAGGGLFADLIVRGREVEESAAFVGRETDRALHVLGALLRESATGHWQISADGTDLSGEYLCVEALNIRFAGPNVPVHPGASTSDGMLGLLLVGEADRDALLAYAEERLRWASGEMPELRVVPAAEVSLVAPVGACFRVDDELWPDDQPLAEAMPVEIRCLAGAATVVGVNPDG